jgi:hypothetical protein
MRYRMILAALALGGLLGPLRAQEQAPLQQFAVPGRGNLQLSVPKEWRAISKSLEEPTSVLLRIRPATGEAFLVQVTAVWLEPAKLAARTEEQLKADVRRSAEKLLTQAVEKEAVIVELRGAQTLGYHYSLTDRAPKPGEYKYMTQGILVTGELLTIFTILYHDPALPEKAQVLQMFAGATYTKGGAAKKSEATPSDRFSFDMPEPRIRFVVPDIPQMDMGVHPNAGVQPHALFMGSGPRGYSISILMPTANAGMTPRDCARSGYGSLVSRYGLDPKSVVTYQANDMTYVVLFPFRVGPLTQLKAYLLSSHGGTHCIEVHISKTVTSTSKEAVSDELAAWYRGFRNANIEVY